MKTKKRKVGRPKLPDREVRDVVSLRLSPDERKEYEQCARRGRERLSTWIRQSLNRVAHEC